MTLKEIITWLSAKSLEEKRLFNELLLSSLMVMNRAIWDNPETSDKMKVECLKWSNELAHRIWNQLFELKLSEGELSETILAENIDFYRKQSDELASYLGPALKSTVERFKYLKKMYISTEP